jgi:hypothetical protein
VKYEELTAVLSCYLAVSYYMLIGQQVATFRTIPVPSFSLKQSNNIELLDCGDEGKGIPLQVWTGPEGSNKLRLTDFPEFKAIGA